LRPNISWRSNQILKQILKNNEIYNCAISISTGLKEI
jgi:hypothetical protein